MAYEGPGADALDYAPCHYGHSRLLFRGPRRRLSGHYIAALGGTETYGKYVAQPYPALLEAHLGVSVVNFGCLNAGLDAILNEPVLAEATGTACLTIVQVVGAQNMSNAFYSVHPRRNDRFLRPTEAFAEMFGDVDVTEVHFTRHLLSLLNERAPDRFAALANGLKEAWVARMAAFLDRLGGRGLLLWIEGQGGADGLGPDPLLVDAAMIGRLAPHAGGVVRVRPSDAARAAGTAGMVFPCLEASAAAGMPGPAVHAEIAAALLPVAEALL